MTAPTRASGPLDTGTVTHRLKQGNFSVQLTYWTSDNAKVYTAESLKTINVAAHVEDADGSHRITVEHFPGDPGRRHEAGRGHYRQRQVRRHPAVSLQHRGDAAGSDGGSHAKLTLTVPLDLLVETAPKSNSYYRSTALDTLTLPLLTNGAARMTELSPGLRRATDRQILVPRSTKAGPLALPPAVPQLAELEEVETVSGEIAAATATPRNATISCIIPCYNEQDTIAEVLRSILAQTRLPDVIHVIINNTNDDTLEIAAQLRGPHTAGCVEGRGVVTTVHVHDIGVNPDKKVGALNYGFFLSRRPTTCSAWTATRPSAGTRCEKLEAEITADTRIGGISRHLLASTTAAARD